MGPRPSSTRNSQSWGATASGGGRDGPGAQGVQRQGQEPRGQAEAAHGPGGEGADPLEQERVAGPDEGRAHRQEVAGQVGQVEAEPAPGDHQGRAAQAQPGAQQVVAAQAAAQVDRRQDDDQQRPEVLQEVHLHRRRVARARKNRAW